MNNISWITLIQNSKLLDNRESLQITAERYTPTVNPCMTIEIFSMLDIAPIKAINSKNPKKKTPHLRLQPQQHSIGLNYVYMHIFIDLIL